MSIQEASEYIKNNIPMTSHIGIQVKAYSSEEVIVEAPLEPNRNHKQTAFGASLYALMVVSCWLWVRKKLQDEGVEAEIVIKSSQANYFKPVRSVLRAECKKPSDSEITDFIKTIKKKSASRLRLKSEILVNGQVCAELVGEFVAVKV